MNIGKLGTGYSEIPKIRLDDCQTLSDLKNYIKSNFPTYDPEVLENVERIIDLADSLLVASYGERVGKSAEEPVHSSGIDTVRSHISQEGENFIQHYSSDNSRTITRLISEINIAILDQNLQNKFVNLLEGVGDNFEARLRNVFTVDDFFDLMTSINGICTGSEFIFVSDMFSLKTNDPNVQVVIDENIKYVEKNRSIYFNAVHLPEKYGIKAKFLDLLHKRGRRNVIDDSPIKMAHMRFERSIEEIIREVGSLGELMTEFSSYSELSFSIPGTQKVYNRAEILSILSEIVDNIGRINGDDQNDSGVISRISKLLLSLTSTYDLRNRVKSLVNIELSNVCNLRIV